MQMLGVILSLSFSFLSIVRRVRFCLNHFLSFDIFLSAQHGPDKPQLPSQRHSHVQRDIGWSSGSAGHETWRWSEEKRQLLLEGVGFWSFFFLLSVCGGVGWPSYARAAHASYVRVICQWKIDWTTFKLVRNWFFFMLKIKLCNHNLL